MAMPQKQDINPATGKQYAVNPATGVWDDTYWAEVVEPKLKAQYGVSGGGGGGGATDIASLAQQMYEASAKFREPAIKTLQAGYGEIPKIFEPQRQAIEAERAPLEQRYQQLLGDITRETTKAQAAEYSRRGIPLTSGIYEQARAAAISPQVERIGLEREAGLRGLTQIAGGLTTQEAQQRLALNQALAAVQATAAPEAISGALNLYQIQQAQQQAAAQQALVQWQAEQQQAQWQTEWPYQQALLEAQAIRQQQLASGGTGVAEPTPFPTFGKISTTPVTTAQQIYGQGQTYAYPSFGLYP